MGSPTSAMSISRHTLNLKSVNQSDAVEPDVVLTKPPTLSASSTTASSIGDTSTPPSPDIPGPPNNFGEVSPGIYRCSFPKIHNFDYLKSLGLRTILTLVPEPHPLENQEFITAAGIIHIVIPIPANKDTFDSIPLASMERALNVLTDKRNHPVLVHCNKGKHRTGCVMGCYRKINDWTLGAILEEYRQYARAKARPLDEKYIELFDEHAMRRALERGNAAAFVSCRPLLTPDVSPLLEGMTKNRDRLVQDTDMVDPSLHVVRGSN